VSVFFANDKILTAVPRDTANRAPEVSDEKSNAVLSKLNGADYDCQFKVTEGGVYILGSEENAKNACTALFGQPKYAAQNDNMRNDYVSPMKNHFAYAGAKFRLGLDFPVAAAAANTQRAPQIGMALRA